MKKSEFRKLIREEVRKVIKESTVSSVMTNDRLNEQESNWVIYAEEGGKKTEVNRVPNSQLKTALSNIGRRYYDNMGVVIAAMTEADWAKINNKQH
jgi:hypothetical protein